MSRANRNKPRRLDRGGRVLGRVVGVAAVGGLLFLLASQFFNIDFGISWKDPATPLAEQVEEKTETAAQTAVEVVEDGVETVQRLVSDPEPEPGPDTKYVGMSVADVLIDGDLYKLLVVDRPEGATAANQGGTASAYDPDVPRRSVAMYEVVRLAKELPGEPSGVRVRIRRTARATAQAERDLLAALYTAKVPDDQIDFREQLVE